MLERGPIFLLNIFSEFLFSVCNLFRSFREFPHFFTFLVIYVNFIRAVSSSDLINNHSTLEAVGYPFDPQCHGMWRRIKVIDFPRLIPEDEMDQELESKLISNAIITIPQIF